jgi:hypothetical protein
MHKKAALNRVNQRPLDLRSVKPKDHNFDTLLGLANAFDDPIYAVAGLDDEFHLQLRCRVGNSRQSATLG